MPAISFKRKKEISLVVYVLHENTQNLVISSCCFANIYDARAGQLFCLLNLLFGDVFVDVAVVVLLSSLLFSLLSRPRTKM